MKNTFLISMFALALGLSSCSLNNDNVTPSAVSAFLVAHTSADAPNVDVYINSSSLVQDVPYGGNTTYVQVSPGIYNIKIAPTGTGTPVIDTNFTYQANTYYSIFTVDSLSKIKAVIVTDSLRTVSADSIRIRFLDFSPNTPAVDFAVAGGSALFSNRTFNDQNALPALANFITVPVNATNLYNFEVRAASQSTILYSVPSLTLVGGKNYTLYLKGFTGGVTAPLSIGTINNL